MSATYQIELANKIGRLNGRSCAVGNLYVVTRRPIGRTTILARFETREAAEAWIIENAEPAPGELGHPVTCQRRCCRLPEGR